MTLSGRGAGGGGGGGGGANEEVLPVSPSTASRFPRFVVEHVMACRCYTLAASLHPQPGRPSSERPARAHRQHTNGSFQRHQFIEN